MKQLGKNLLSFLLKFGISAALLIYLFSKIDVKNFVSILKTVDLNYIYFALAAFVFINFIILLRWYVLIKALDLEVRFSSATYCFLIGLFFNLFLPGSTGGDIVRTIGLFKDTSEKPKVVATVLLDRLSGFTAIVIVALISFIFAYKTIQDNSLLIFIVVLFFVLGGILSFLFNEKLYSFGCRIFNRWPKVKEQLMRLHYAIALLKKKRWGIILPILISCCTQGILAFIFYLVARSLHQDAPMIYFLIFVPLICVISSFPSIAGLGVRDAGSAYLFGKIGIDAATAVSISLINFFFMVFVGLIGGLVYVLTLSSRRVQYHEAHPSQNG